jgi:hypothetical protein
MKTLFGDEGDPIVTTTVAQKAKPEEPAWEPAAARVDYSTPEPRIAAVGDVECADTSCGSLAHDILAERMVDLEGSGVRERAWLAECCLCGTSHWMPARAIPKKQEVAGDKDFRFQSGLFCGLTIAEASVQTRGIDYLTWVAEHDRNDKVRHAVKTWLASHAKGQ